MEGLPPARMTPTDADTVKEAAEALREADALLICAGAGMGVDSGLPDFRGPEGFWRAYPAARALGLEFEELANPAWFQRDPTLAWGFYGHRLEMYRRTPPHAGFEILRRWAADKSRGWFVYTSNVDGHFQQAGFDDARIVECHGSLRHLQCERPCCAATWPVPDDFIPDVDAETLRARAELPKCTVCGGLARPNVLMFGDGTWSPGRTSAQQIRFRLWLKGLARGHLAVIELGAGSAVPTVRHTAEQISRAAGARLIRVNPNEPEAPDAALSLRMGALEALRALDGYLNACGA